MNNMQRCSPLDTGDAKDYRTILSMAFNAASAFDGSQAGYDRLMDKLIAVERFIRERGEERVTEDVERRFAKSAGMEGPFDTISALLDHAAGRVHDQPSRIDGLDDVLAVLSQNGAVIHQTETAFVLTDDGEPRRTGEVGLARTVAIQQQPRLTTLVRELQTIGIHADDLVLHVGTLPEQTARKLPYVLVDIPRLQKQVAVCDQYGEITFVSRGILPPHVWGSSTKSELKAMTAMDVVAFGPNWASRICNLLKADRADPDLVALLNAFSPPEPDLGDWRTRAAMTVDKLYLSVSETHAATGEPPRADHGIVAYGPLKGLLTWKNVDQEIKDEVRSTGSSAVYLASSLAKFCDTVGFFSTRTGEPRENRTSRGSVDSSQPLQTFRGPNL